MARGVFIDGTGATPGTEKCRCDLNCEFPCWQRIGIAGPCEMCGCKHIDTVVESAERITEAASEHPEDGVAPEGER